MPQKALGSHSFTGGRFDLPGWQRLYDKLKDQNFMLIAVAMDSRGVDALRGPITKAKTTYTSLVDRDHLVSGRYNMVNVPQAVWFDEAGRIVRPTEVSGFALTLNLLKVRKTRESVTKVNASSARRQS
jgi:hypothetical protein